MSEFNWNALGDTLQGAGQHLAGRGPAWEAIQERKRVNDAELDERRRQAALIDAYSAVQLWESGQGDKVPALLENRIRNIRSLRGDPSHTEGLLQRFYEDAPGTMMELKSRFNAMAQMQRGMSGPTSEMQTFDYMTRGLSQEDRERARMVELGLVPRAGMSAAERIAADPNLSSAVARSTGEIEGSKETAKLTARYNLEPKIQQAVKAAVSGAQAVADQAKLDKSNASAFAVYEAGMTGLMNALDETMTGPFVGMLPAVTSNQQFANGARAALAPVMKQMFRASGEGIFTDKDQELLLAMIPDRTDRPEARLAKLQNIDAIVRAKLGMPLGGSESITTTAPGSPSAYEQWRRENQR